MKSSNEVRMNCILNTYPHIEVKKTIMHYQCIYNKMIPKLHVIVSVHATKRTYCFTSQMSCSPTRSYDNLT